MGQDLYTSCFRMVGKLVAGRLDTYEVPDGIRRGRCGSEAPNCVPSAVSEPRFLGKGLVCHA